MIQGREGEPILIGQLLCTATAGGVFWTMSHFMVSCAFSTKTLKSPVLSTCPASPSIRIGSNCCCVLCCSQSRFFQVLGCALSSVPSPLPHMLFPLPGSLLPPPPYALEPIATYPSGLGLGLTSLGVCTVRH